MGSLHKKFKKYLRPGSARALSHAFNEFDDAHVIGETAEKQYDATKAAEAAAKAQEAEPVMPIADEDALKRSRRRSNQRRRYLGRASTILGSDAETLG